MAETCYSQGKKIVLMPEQMTNGMWRCRFAIPGLVESDLGTSPDSPLGKYSSEWDAKTAAFAAAKRALDASRKAMASSPSEKVL